MSDRGRRLCVPRAVRRLLVDDAGQDLIEYALLTAVLTAAGIGLFPLIAAGMANAYSAWGSDAYNLWTPAAPVTVP
jgi:Flp pilus assembly pilin Flp